MSAKLTGGCGCSGMVSSADIRLLGPPLKAAPAEAGCCPLPSWPPLLAAWPGVAKTRGWLTEGSVFLRLILCLRFFNMVA